MTLQSCDKCAYWQGGEGVVWCQQGRCYTETHHLTHCYVSKEERFEKKTDEYRILKKIGKFTKDFPIMKYIDLGLPSGNLWAAENEEGYYTFDEAETEFGDCLPTKEDFEELVAHCWKRWDNERKGMEFMGDNGTKLFLPAAGCRYEQRVCNAQVCGYYWSSSYYDSNDAYYVHFDFSYLNPQSLNYRTSEFSVRLIKRGGTK